MKRQPIRLLKWVVITISMVFMVFVTTGIVKYEMLQYYLLKLVGQLKLRY